MKKIKMLSTTAFRLMALMLCLAVAVPQSGAETYTVAGSDTQALGASWSPSTGSNDMSLYTGTSDIYYLVKPVTYSSTTTYEYKITVDHSWSTSYGDNGGSGNASYAINAGSGYTTYVFNSSTHVPRVVSSCQTVVIAGDDVTALGSSTWNETNTDNSMTTTDGITYTLTRTLDYTSGGQKQCKAVVAGSQWFGTSSNQNVYYNIGGAGSYIVTYTFNAVTGIVTATAEAQAPPTVDYYVKGDSTVIFTNGWNSGASTMMAESNGTYSWSANGVHLYAGTYPYKVWGSDNSWYPSGSNATFTITTPGTYNVTITFDGSNDPVATPVLVQADQTYTYDIYVRYTGNESLSNVYAYCFDDNGYNPLGTWGGTKLSDMTMTTINGFNYYHVTVTSSDASMKVIFNENQSSSTQTANLSLNVGDNYFTYGGGSTVSGPNAQADVATTYYAVGDDTNIFTNGWSMGSGTELDDNGDGTYSWTSGNVHLTPGVYYTYKVRDNQNHWYPSGDNQTFNVNVPGTYTVTVTYDSNTGIVTATPTLITADPISNVYVVGYANTQQWAANAGIPMEYDNETGYYTLKNVVLTAMSHFAFATVLGSNSEDWATLNANRLSTDDNSHMAINNERLNVWLNTVNYSDDNHNWYVEQSGAYDIDFNPNTRQVRVKRSYSHLYISYGVDWSYQNNSEEMSTTDGNTYQATISFNEGDYFLFSTALNNESAWGATSPNYEISSLMIGFAQRLAEDSINNFHLTAPSGKYIVVVNLIKNTVTLRKTADATVTKVFLQKASNVTLNPAGGTYQGQTLEGKRGGIYAWNKLNTEMMGGTYQMSQDGPTNYTYQGEVVIDGNNYGGNNYLKDLSDTTTVDGKEWYGWSIANSICEFYFIRSNQPDYKSQKIMRRAGEVWLIWLDEDATSNRQDDAQQRDSLQDVTSQYYDVTASGVSDCATMLEDHYYVYYTNTTGWDSVYCYAWNENNGLIRFTDEYPGNKCTFVGYDEDGYEVWCYDFGLMEDFHRIYGKDENDEYIIPTHVIFDNGKGGTNTGIEGDSERQQTGDLLFDNGACYDYLGMVYLGNSLNGIINTGIVNGPKYTVEDNLIGVYYDEDAITKIIETDTNGNPVYDEHGQVKHIDVVGALYAKDFDNYSAKSIQPDGTVDYVYRVCAHPKTPTYPGGSQIQIKREKYDQSNWVKIVLSPNFDNKHLQNTDVTYNKDLFDDDDFESATSNNRKYLEQYVGKIIPGGSMSGNLVSNVNPQMHITNIAMPIATDVYEKNVYVTGHFNDTVVFSYVHRDWSPGIYDGVYRTVPVWKTEDGVTSVDHMKKDGSPVKMFYVAPKPQEVAYITWAVFTHDNPSVGTTDCTSEPEEPGEFHAPMNWDRTGQLWDGTNPLDTTGAPYGSTYGPYSNGYMQYAAFQVNWSLFGDESHLNDNGLPWYQIFKPGHAYKILAVIRYAHGDKPEDVEYSEGVIGSGTDYNEGPGNHVANAPRRVETMNVTPYDDLESSKFIVFPLNGKGEGTYGDDLGDVTTVKEVIGKRTVTNVRYYNLMGAESDQPFDGINIVVTTYSDGSRTSKKIMR